VESLRSIVRFRDSLPEGKRPHLEVGISTAFGCTLQGAVDEGWALEMARQCAEAGADTVGLSDSVGYANPAQIKRMFTQLVRDLGPKAGGAHLHNTRGQGLANVVAALDAGVTTFDASQGGIGGCPYAPGATGNIVTEDLVFLLEAMGLDTGVDMEKLLAARRFLAEGLPGEPVYGYVPDAGLPKNFRRAAEPVGT
jgi:hydroxymethylglutaryl-CoA lyase